MAGPIDDVDHLVRPLRSVFDWDQFLLRRVVPSLRRNIIKNYDNVIKLSAHATIGDDRIQRAGGYITNLRRRPLVRFGLFFCLQQQCCARSSGFALLIIAYAYVSLMDTRALGEGYKLMDSGSFLLPPCLSGWFCGCFPRLSGYRCHQLGISLFMGRQLSLT